MRQFIVTSVILNGRLDYKPLNTIVINMVILQKSLLEHLKNYFKFQVTQLGYVIIRLNPHGN